MNETLTRLANQFQRFGERECLPASPLYARLAIGIAGDEQLLALAATALAHPVPNLLFGAVHYLLLGDVTHPLAAFYPSICEVPLDSQAQDPFPVFRTYCLDHAAVLTALLTTRRVQTNEVRRCTALLPAFTLVARRGGDRPLALVEIGASAGLNLLWDRFSYTYDDLVCGEPTSPVALQCALRGPVRPPLPVRMPSVMVRLGLDLHPIDINDEADVRWLQALIWPEQRVRVTALQQAVALARTEPPVMQAGDALTLLPDVVAHMPSSALLCVYHSFVLNQFSQGARERFDRMLDAVGATRDVAIVGIEWHEPAPRLTLTTYLHAIRSEQVLAVCDAHGAWLAWN